MYRGVYPLLQQQRLPQMTLATLETQELVL
jgi:hypothetical protein